VHTPVAASKNLTAEQRRTRARLAARTRWSGKTNDPDLDDARRDLRAAAAEGFIRRVVAAAPPLSAEQRARIAVILLGGDAP